MCCSIDQKSEWCRKCPIFERCSGSVFLFLGQAATDTVGGWASILHMGTHEKTLSGFHYDVGENDDRTALIGFISTLKAFKSTTKIYAFTTSEYLWNGIINGYVDKDGKNQSLWAECHQYSQMHNMSVCFIRLDEDPELVDESIRNRLKKCKNIALQCLYDS